MTCRKLCKIFSYIHFQPYFIQHQQDLMELVDLGSDLNLNKKKVRLEFFKLIKLSVYETIIFMVEHQNRHLQQALRNKDLF